MALVVKDRVKETTATTGTGTLTLAGAVAGFQAFSSALSDGDTTYYAIFESSTGEWEVGLGTFALGSTTLARTSVLASSNAGSAVNLTAGNAEVFITQPAGKTVVFDASGDLTLNQDPTSALQAATKQYVDTIAAAGIHYHSPVRVESPTALNAAYNNGTSGVGATLTNSGTQAALVIDGITLNTSDRVLIYTQTNAAHNGVYTVTDTGSVSTNWVLTRATDADSYGASDPDALGEGDAFFVSEGDTGAGELYVMNTSGTITFGTTNITFTQIASTAVYSAGNGLTLTGTTFAVGAGTGVTVNANDVAIGQDVSVSADVTFNTVTADLIGNADTATTASGVAPNSVALSTDTTGNYVAAGAVSGNGLSGSASSEGATFTVTSNATNANTPSTIVFRDGSGNFSAGTITANLSGNATTATTATTANGVAANSVALGTDTTGNYVATIATNAGLDGSGSSEGAAVTLSLDLSELTTSTSDADGDFFVVVDSANAQKKLTKANINISGFNNDAGYTTNVGDITGVTAGSFITGGGTSGTVTINVDATSANTASKVVARDGSGNFSAGTITAALSGNASTATKWATGRTITLTGDVTGTSAAFDGSGNLSFATTIAANSVALGTDTTGNYVAAGATSGNGLSGSVSSEGGTFTVTSNATNANTASTIVFRDASGNFSAGTITAALSGNASTATTLQTARTINGVSFNGSANITVEAYIENDESTAATRYLTFVDNTTASFKRLNEDSSLTYNPSTNTLTAGTFSGALSGNATTATNISGYSGTYWTSNNDGSGSGLDADLWDGNQFSSYLNQAVLTTSSPTFANPTVTDLYVGDQIFHTGDTDTYMQFHAANQWRVVTGGTEMLEVNDTNIIASANLDINADINGVNNIYLAGTLYHEGDTNTYLSFGTDTIALRTGGTDRLNISNSDFTVNSAVKEDYDALSGTTPTIDVDTGGGFSLTTSGNTTFTFSSFTSGVSCGFVLELTAGGTHTITWPASVDWAGGTAPDAPASGETNIYVFWSRDGGTTWYGVQSIDAAS